MQNIGDVPLLGVGKWPLDYFWNRALKRTEDIVGSLVGLLVSAPLIALAALLIKVTSPFLPPGNAAGKRAACSTSTNRAPCRWMWRPNPGPWC